MVGTSAPNYSNIPTSNYLGSGFFLNDLGIIYNLGYIRLYSHDILTYAASLITGIFYFFFGLLFLCATLRFANYDSLSEALSIGEVWADLMDIGILKVILAVVAIAVTASIIMAGSIFLISISSFAIFLVILIVIPFLLLFGSYALGLLYSEIA